MKIEKQIITTETIDIDITGITLLSIEEYEKNKDIIPKRDSWWWLRSPYKGDAYGAGYVKGDGKVDFCNVDLYHVGVSPALIYNLDSSNLVKGDKVNIAGYTWTVLDDGLILYDDIIGKCCFREDREADDANVYEKSDIKKYAEKWFGENIK